MSSVRLRRMTACVKVCVRRPSCAPRHRHRAGIRKPSQKRPLHNRSFCKRQSEANRLIKVREPEISRLHACNL